MAQNVYAAVGHWKDSKNITAIINTQNTKKAFMRDCYGNNFVPYVVMTEAVLEKIFSLECNMDVFEQVKKLTSNYRVWNAVTDYLTEGPDMLRSARLLKAERAK